MGNVIEFKPKKKTESIEALGNKLIGMINQYTSNITSRFLTVPEDTLSKSHDNVAWRVSLITHLNKIGYGNSELLNALSDEALKEEVTDNRERIRLLQFSFMRQHFNDSLLPDYVPRIKALD